jgi:uncharacterized protein (TIGR02646 family)
MRVRDLRRINPPQDWKDAAKEAVKAVRDGASVKKYSKIWQSLKLKLSDASYGKCWYCESRQVRADNAVDHFRPKSKYPWHAFSVDNFRYACTFCNSRRANPVTGEAEGKGDFFPLLDGSTMATCEAEIDSERPVLLDPCLAADAALLDFTSDGMACPADPDQPIVVKRVNESIRFYSLNHPELADQRRLLALRVGDWVKNADRLYPKAGASGDLAIERAFQRFVQNIAESMDDHAEMSAFTRRMVKCHRTKPWVEQLLAVA